MLNFSELVQHVSQTPSDSVREPLLSYFSAKAFYQKAITPDSLQSFIFDILDFPYWHQKRTLLSRELRPLFSTQEFQHIAWPDEIQVIEVERLPDQIEIIQRFCQQIHGDASKTRVLFDPTQRKVLSLSLLPSGEVQIRQFSKFFTLEKGQITPLRKDLTLTFGQDLELQPQIIHKIEVAPHTTALFSISGNSITGTTIHGYTMKKQNEYAGELLLQTGRLLYTIKRLEQFILKKECNPFYAELTLGLEQMINLLKSGSRSAQNSVQQLAIHARNCLEHVFVGDKFLSLLLRELEQCQSKPFDSTN